MKPFRILLYYHYQALTDPLAHRDEHHRFALEHGLLGRIIVSQEGINGTVSGTEADCRLYMAWLSSRFAGIAFKVEAHEGHAFYKLFVRVKDEIVHSELGVDPLQRTGIHLEPADFARLKNDPDVVLVDMRSAYEHRVGKFRGAITFEMDNLRELPRHLGEIEHLRHSGKKIITYCTGGIKCEKASAYLLEQGFENVYQLHGGIIRYGLEQGGEDFEGECYVFDNRVTTPINRVNPSLISQCHHCQTPTARMVNCANADCNAHLPMCEACSQAHAGCCSASCGQSPARRPYDGTGAYPKIPNHYTPEQGFRSARGHFTASL